jgi:hypothetical protein
MNIIERNFFRLLRAGAFATSEQIEPLSAWKWNRLYQLSEMHDVAAIVYQGLSRCSDQFFVQVPEQLLENWSKAANKDSDDENDLLHSDHLTNPILNNKLQNILDAEDSNTETRTALLHMTGIARFIMNAGIPVKRITEFGLFLRQTNGKTDFTILQQWIRKLKLEPMSQLVAAMLIRLLHFTSEELPFMAPATEEQMDKIIREMFRQKNSHAEEWYFSQGKNIFVHTSNSSAMLWSVRRSAKYFRYYPTETVTNFFTSFAHSLSHIEE